ncbi:hypothetical protein [Chondromyces crocatus]|uniref:Copper type II ascorbate-dependent monooxygenase C-terminal domain-containing protein n=1 Tax=Chondromyces crocatus TaxID=52 RepID=A0A0K1EAU8_CHOCO|nr:hypothetical protein [Chondromyces crocatus]AKT37979.1 uncharacterized protein CMC5_021200 [Chondromyces crocatus]
MSTLITPWIRGLALASAVLVTGCASGLGDVDGPAPAGEAAAMPTFHRDVAPILRARCQSCHAPGEIAPFSLSRYEDVKAVARLVVARTEDRSMPPWGAWETEACSPRFGWKDDNRLTDAELATLRAWEEAGAPEGEVASAPAPEGVARGGLSEVSAVVEPAAPFVARGDADQLRCFVMDPGLEEDVWVGGLNVVPGNAKVVHHVVVFVDGRGASEALAGPDGSYDCQAGPQFEGVRVLGTWVPGGRPSQYPPGSGYLLPAGARLVTQVHYHPAGAVAAPDRTRVELQFLKETPEYRAIFFALGNQTRQRPDGDGLQPGPGDRGEPEFLVPAGAKGHTETIRMRVPEEFMGESLREGFKVHSVMPHMHYVGTDIRIEVERPGPRGADPAAECLVGAPRWSFDWQQTYAVDAPLDALPTLQTGDRVTLQCTYDNSIDNPFVKRALLEEHLPGPRDVVLGEGSLDEMCLGLFTGLVRN